MAPEHRSHLIQVWRRLFRIGKRNIDIVVNQDDKTGFFGQILYEIVCSQMQLLHALAAFLGFKLGGLVAQKFAVFPSCRLFLSVSGYVGVARLEIHSYPVIEMVVNKLNAKLLVF